MEAIESISEAEWSCFNGICSDEADFMSQLLTNCSDLNEYPSSSNTAYWLSQDDSNFTTTFLDENSLLSANDANPNSYCFPTNDNSMIMDFPLLEPKASYSQRVNNVMEGDLNKDECLTNVTHKPFQEDGIVSSSSPLEISKKRVRSNGEVQRSKRSGKQKKAVDEENRNRVFHRQNSTCSENGPQEPTSKKRANPGSATDPQSLYARKRRERINERLRILQSLVPNGTKVDISTMLEEAVQYVKFLQLQIKLLSSDELWMYAPIAYNGMDLTLRPSII